ncbi:MAG: tRNA (adenosine(37)-N6)-threonylcarbamoyltransferase complex dimerization subunit type 1 TsaB [Anaeroplasmataceae bacterium]
MYKLLVDSSTKTLYIALVYNDMVVDERYIEGRNDHAKNILSQIEDILNKQNIKIKDLDSIICGVGPGSYTGVRMAVTVGKMVATNTNVGLYGVSSLYLMSSGYDGNIVSYIDARRGNSFSVAYSNDKALCEEKLRNTKEFLSEYEGFMLVSEDNMKVDALKVINHASLVLNPHGFVPNYLRETEAERNKEND